jgi:thioredoxin-related protein
MTREVYSNREFIEFSRSQIFLRIFIDKDAGAKDLARRYGVEGLPTIIIFNPEGREVDRISGFTDAEDLMEILGYIFESREDGAISL